MIDTLVDTGLPTKICCRVLGVSGPGYYKYRNRPLSRTQMRRQWLTGLIREVHVASRGTYGSRRIHAELTLAMGVEVSERLVAVLMHNAGIAGLCRDSQGEATTGCRHGWRSGEPKVSSPQSQRTVGHRHHRASNARGQGLLLLCARYLQSKNRRLVDRHDPKLEPRGKRTRHGNQESSPRAGRCGSRRSRSPVHLMGLHRSGSQSRSHAELRLSR